MRDSFTSKGNVLDTEMMKNVVSVLLRICKTQDKQDSHIHSHTCSDSEEPSCLLHA